MTRRKKDEALKQRKAEAWRKESKSGLPTPDHLWIPKSFFQTFAEKRGLDIFMIDDADLKGIEFYHSAAYRFSVLLSKASDEIQYLVSVSLNSDPLDSEMR